MKKPKRLRKSAWFDDSPPHATPCAYQPRTNPAPYKIWGQGIDALLFETTDQLALFKPRMGVSGSAWFRA